MEKNKCIHIDDTCVDHTNIYYDNTILMVCDICLDNLRKTHIKKLYLNYEEKHLFDIVLTEPFDKKCCKCKKNIARFIITGREPFLFVNSEQIEFYKFLCKECYHKIPTVDKYASMKISI